MPIFFPAQGSVGFTSGKVVVKSTEMAQIAEDIRVEGDVVAAVSSVVEAFRDNKGLSRMVETLPSSVLAAGGENRQ